MEAIEYIRDNISHSADVNEDIITCTASEVLKVGHGICFAKSYLLAALLRCKSIPTGFCYQKLILDEFSIRPEMGAVDSFLVFLELDVKVLEKLRCNKTRTELWDNLPSELTYKMQ